MHFTCCAFAQHHCVRRKVITRKHGLEPVSAAATRVACLGNDMHSVKHSLRVAQVIHCTTTEQHHCVRQKVITRKDGLEPVSAAATRVACLGNDMHSVAHSEPCIWPSTDVVPVAVGAPGTQSCNPESVGLQAFGIGCMYMQETVSHTLPG